jgi:predicted lipoprotein with Yx(FWY)xxD motif
MRHRLTGQMRAGGDGRRRSARVLVPAALLALTLALAAMALGAKGAFTVTSAHSAGLGERIVVDPQGRTLYVLSPETAHHLLCKSKECLKFWPPLTVSSRKAKPKGGPGVNGKLGIIRRKRGVFQVTLRGMPVYRFSGDHAAGQTNGQGIRGFGGTWYAATASPGAGKAPGSEGPGGVAGANGNANGGPYETPRAGTPSTPTGAVSSSSTTTSSTMMVMSTSTSSARSYEY